MIELQSDELIFAFPELLAPLRARVRSWVDERLESATNDEKNMLPSSREEVHRAFAACIPRVSAAISFQRTLRMPDNGREYPMPLGLGRFEIYPIEDFAAIPDAWRQRGGVMLAMHPSEALWLNFYADYPMALRVGAGGKCAVSGQPWSTTLKATPQNYVVLGCQPWLDGLHASPDVVTQFLGSPVGQGLQAVHALSGEERWGGLQLQAVPLRVEDFWRQSLKGSLVARWDELMTPIRHRQIPPAPSLVGHEADWIGKSGGKIRLKIVDDPYGLPTWDPFLSSRCFAHLCLASDWERLTGIRPPQKAPTAEDYRAAGVPFVDFEGARPRAGTSNPMSWKRSANPWMSGSERGGLLQAATPPARSIVRLNPDLRQKVQEF